MIYEFSILFNESIIISFTHSPAKVVMILIALALLAILFAMVVLNITNK